MLWDEINTYFAIGASITALGLFIFEFWKVKNEIKERRDSDSKYDAAIALQKKEIEALREQTQYADYQKLRDHHQELIRMQVNNPRLFKIWDNDNKKPRDKIVDNLTKEEELLFHFYILQFDLLERVYDHFTNTEPENIGELEAWLDWTRPMANHWLFEFTLDEYSKRGLYNEFYKWIREKLVKKG